MSPVQESDALPSELTTTSSFTYRNCPCAQAINTPLNYTVNRNICLFSFLPPFPPLNFFTLTQPRVNRTFPFVRHFSGESAIPACTSHQHMHFKRRIQILSANDTKYSKLFHVTSSISHVLLRRKAGKERKVW